MSAERAYRISLGKTAKGVLKRLAENGPAQLSHGSRYAEIDFGPIRVMSSTNYLLRSSCMIEWAGGNYDRWTVRITDYGRECLRRGSRDANIRCHQMDTYGPRRSCRWLGRNRRGPCRHRR